MSVSLEKLGYPTAGASLVKALDTWAGTENFEERLVPGKLDPVVLQQLRRQAAGTSS